MWKEGPFTFEKIVRHRDCGDTTGAQSGEKSQK